MTKKNRIELNRANDLADIDAELDDALARLDATTTKVGELLSSESGTPVPIGEVSGDDTADNIQSDVDDA